MAEAMESFKHRASECDGNEGADPLCDITPKAHPVPQYPVEDEASVFGAGGVLSPRHGLEVNPRQMSGGDGGDGWWCDDRRSGQGVRYNVAVAFDMTDVT